MGEGLKRAVLAARRSRSSRAGLLSAVDAFCRAANIVDSLPAPVGDDRPLRDVLPGLWPTVGDLRALRAEAVALGWKRR